MRMGTQYKKMSIVTLITQRNGRSKSGALLYAIEVFGLK